MAGAIAAGRQAHEGGYRTVRDLVHAHLGRPAVVLCGAPSLFAELERCPPRPAAIYLSANDHGARLTACDYLVCLDKIRDRLLPFGKPIISRHLWADYRIVEKPQVNTGIQTALVARLMGCAPIYLCGVGCYDPALGTYHDDPDAASAGFRIPSALHASHWANALRRYPADYRVMGGPLAAELGEWTPPAGPAPRARLLEDVAGVEVELPESIEYKGRSLPAGVVELRAREAQQLVRARIARHTAARAR